MASRFWVGGGASTNWDATGNTNWSATSGGANNASVPTTGDDVFFDGNSGSGTAVMNVSPTIATIDFTGFTGTFTHNPSQTLTISGLTCKFASGMTYGVVAGNNRIIAFTSTAGTTQITTAGKTMPSLTFNGSGGTFQLQDSYTGRADSIITLTLGTFDTNNQTISNGFIASNNSNTRTLTLGTSTITLTGTSGSIWDMSTTGTLNLTASSSTINASAVTAVNTRTMNLGASKTYGTIGLASGAAQYRLDVSAGTAVTIGTVNMTSPVAVYFTASITYTITNAVTWAGSSSNSPIVLMPGPGVTATLALAGSSTMTWAVIGGLTFTGSPTASNSLSMGGNSGITISGPSGGGGTTGVIGG